MESRIKQVSVHIQTPLATVDFFFCLAFVAGSPMPESVVVDNDMSA